MAPALLGMAVAIQSLHAVDPVSVTVPEPVGWTGQRIPIVVELRSPGSFGGATGFSLPQIPRSLLFKVGNPTVSSERIEGETWFVQRHEFALYSQEEGVVDIPAFPVRYGTRDGFSGPVTDIEGLVPAAQVEIRRPPGTEGIGFLVTTDTFSVKESWDPKPGEAKMGDVFKRTISQEAEDVSGMALLPAPVLEIEGLRGYRDDPEVRDFLERGEFRGQRTDTLTYLVQAPGDYEIPSITYAWWDPDGEVLETKILPAVSFSVAAPPPPAEPERRMSPYLWAIVIVAFFGIVAAILQRKSLAALVRKAALRLNPPEKVALRRVLKACQSGDARAARHALFEWMSFNPPFNHSPEFEEAVRELNESLYSRSAPSTWDGGRLARVLRERKARGTPEREAPSALPPLNP